MPLIAEPRFDSASTRERRGGDHGLARRDPLQHLCPVVGGHAENHLTRRERAVGSAHKHQIALARREHSRSRHADDRRRRCVEAEGGVHPWLETEVCICQDDADAGRPGLGIEGRVDVGDPPRANLARERLELGRHLLAEPDCRQVQLKHLSLQPDDAEVGDLVERLPRHDPLPLEHRLLDHHPIHRRAQGDVLPDLAGALESLHLGRGDVPVEQAPAGGFQEVLGPAHRVRRSARHVVPKPLGENELLGGGYHHRRVDAEQGITAPHCLAGKVHVQPIHQPVDQRGDGLDPGLVVGHEPDRPDTARKRSQRRLREDDSDLLLVRRRQHDFARGVRHRGHPVRVPRGGRPRRGPAGQEVRPRTRGDQQEPEQAEPKPAPSSFARRCSEGGILSRHHAGPGWIARADH